MLVGEVIARMALDSKHYEKGLSRLEGITQKKALTLGGIFKGAFSFALGIGLMSGFQSLGGAITDFINTAARAEVLNVAMLSVARSSGYMRSAVEADKKAVMELGIAEQEATQILTRFMQAQLDTADAAKLARVAQDAAVIAGYNSSQAAEQMTEAIAKQRPELLSAFGMTRNMNEIYNDYAKTVGKTVKQLSEAEKKQAMLNYILAEGEKIAGTYEASMGAVGKQIGSLPRYWDTLKNTIAKPLALPAISVIVDGITNALKNAISWAEANRSTLQRWGQTAANVAGYIIRAFKYVGQIFAQNWALIRFVGIALLTYATATRIAAAATTIFKIASSVLKGTIAANVPILSALSIAINTYRLQVALAPVATNVFSAALYRLQAALHAVHVALGPIGWAILLVSGLVAGGMALWNKYTRSVNKAWEASMAEKMKAQQEKLADSTKGATRAAKDQADALTNVGKAARGNLQSFDEIHQLQGDMAGQDLGLGLEQDTGLFGLDAWDTEGLFDFDLEVPKATLADFWEWIKQGFADAMNGIKTWWGNTAFAKWWKEDVAPWFTKERWVQLYTNIKSSLEERWNNLKIWWKNTTLVKWWNEDVKPWFTKDRWLQLFDSMRTSIQEKWHGLRTWWKNTTLVKWWSEDVAPWFTKKKWLDLLDNIRLAFKDMWESAKLWGKNLIDGFIQGIKNKAESVKNSLKNIGNTIKNFLGFSSPTKEGPGRYADQWAPNLMSMFAEGLRQGVPMVRNEAAEIAKQLTSIKVLPTVQTPGAAMPLENSTGLVDNLVKQLAADMTTLMQGAGEGDIEVNVYLDTDVLLSGVVKASQRKNARAGKTVVSLGVS